MKTIRYALHTVKTTKHGEKTFKTTAALDRWVERQEALGRDVEILAHERERGDDDGVEYGDPRDAMEDRLLSD